MRPRHQKVTTGVIAAAGNAARMWPASKVFPKELFPLGRLPVLFHLIWEMVEAGLTHIIIVVRQEGFGAVEALLDPRLSPPASVHGDPVVRKFETMIRRPRFTFVPQKGPYGNGTPLLNGFGASDGGPCVYAFADDVVFGENVTAGLVATYRRTGQPVLAAQPVPQKDVVRFGILETRGRGVNREVTRFVEKPRPGETRSRLASLGRYLVTTDVVDTLKRTHIGRDRELWLADAFRALLEAERPISAYALTAGRWYTVGNPEGYRDAVVAATRLGHSNNLYKRT